jgi:membrane protein YdbS with pleckstrin-like domain
MDDATSTAIATGAVQRLAPEYISVQRAARWIAVGILGLIALPFMLLAIFAGWNSSVVLALWPVAAWLVFVGLLGWWAHAWPALAYRYASYVVAPEGIEIRRGVLWRLVINVPRTRVQHTDVSQGPLERSHDLGTLVIYTAGTDDASVHLPGLPHPLALRIRDHLLPRSGDDVV